jgi:alpha-tubulin suppressor-like RCC1 family protein
MGYTIFYGAFHFVEGRAISSISSGDTHSCGLDADGSVLCWGSNDEGQLGDVTAEPTTIAASEHVVIEAMRVTAAEPFGHVSAGARHTCALDRSGRAYCWGEANGEVRQRLTAVPGDVTFATLNAGDGFTCGVSRDGRAFCWGRNSHGQLGNGTTTDSVEPTPVAGSQDFTSVSAGRNHACGLMADGLLYCWGRGAEGELGNGSTADQPTPALVAYQR